MPAIFIRPSKACDFEAIFRLLEQLWDYKKLDKKKLRKVFLGARRDKNQRSYVAKHGNRVIGFAGAMIQNNMWQGGKMCHLSELIVDETVRGKGTGTKLLKTVEAYARRKKCAGMDLESAMRRKRSHKFYEARRYDKKAFFFTKLFGRDS
jgi:GNAT superfamily N-acetyltransferase